MDGVTECLRGLLACEEATHFKPAFCVRALLNESTKRTVGPNVSDNVGKDDGLVKFGAGLGVFGQVASNGSACYHSGWSTSYHDHISHRQWSVRNLLVVESSFD